MTAYFQPLGDVSRHTVPETQLAGLAYCLRQQNRMFNRDSTNQTWSAAYRNWVIGRSCVKRDAAALRRAHMESTDHFTRVITERRA
jgi:hypothetical protein